MNTELQSHRGYYFEHRVTESQSFFLCFFRKLNIILCVSVSLCLIPNFRRYSSHLLVPVVSERINLHFSGSDGIGDDIHIAVGKLPLHEHRLHPLGAGCGDDLLKFGCRRLPAMLLQCQLLQTVVGGKVGEGWMIDDE